MTREEEYEFYAKPANRELRGTPRRRTAKPDDSHPVRFSEAIMRARAEPDSMSGVSRVAVRVLLLDGRSRVLLFEGRDLSDPTDTLRWWFTVGGGVEPGESLTDAAHRELEEETGLLGIQVADLQHRRTVEFMSHGEPLRQTEQFFAARTDDVALSTTGWTALEQRAVISWRWWSTEELDATSSTYYPEDLPVLVRRADSVV